MHLLTNFLIILTQDCWMAMDPKELVHLAVDCAPALVYKAPEADPASMAECLEKSLMALLTQARQGRGLETFWDQRLSQILAPALCAYNTERITGLVAGNEEFQHAIRRYTPKGHTFQGYPDHFPHAISSVIFSESLDDLLCRDIVYTSGLSDVQIFLFSLYFKNLCSKPGSSRVAHKNNSLP